MTRLEELNAEKARLNSELRVVSAAIHDEECAAAGIKVGDWIVGTEGRLKGVEAQVTNVRPSFRCAWVDGVSRKKDGSLRTIPHHFYGYWQKAPTP